MSKIAQQIAKQFNNTEAAGQAAEVQAISKDQIWDGEGYTIYVFDDNSFLAQSGPLQCAVDADDSGDVDAYEAWLGDDAQYDKARIEDMREALS